MYASVAVWRRGWYARHPEARRRLRRPVISVGNLTAGGTGKTPLVAHLTRLLLAGSERPAILSRGYGRAVAPDGVVVVRTPARVLADLDRSGDEPLMLARALEGASVLVSSDRFLAGCLAERRLGCSVHVLDDGFQHVQLERDVDLVVVDADGIDGERSLPAGRLREPLSSAALADAVIVNGTDAAGAEDLARRLGAPRGFVAVRALGAARLVEPFGQTVPLEPGTRVLAVAGIARPGRFFASLAASGLVLARELAFRDHHAFTRRDVDEIVRLAGATHVDLVLTTEKDLMRLLPLRPLRASIGWVPVTTTVEPTAEFRAWLKARLAGARERDEGGGRRAEGGGRPSEDRRS